jgi:hypothetical protein
MPTVLDVLPGKTHNNLVKVTSKRSFSVIGFLSSKIDKKVGLAGKIFLITLLFELESNDRMDNNS